MKVLLVWLASQLICLSYTMNEMNEPTKLFRGFDEAQSMARNHVVAPKPLRRFIWPRNIPIDEEHHKESKHQQHLLFQILNHDESRQREEIRKQQHQLLVQNRNHVENRQRDQHLLLVQNMNHGEKRQGETFYEGVSQPKKKLRRDFSFL